MDYNKILKNKLLLQSMYNLKLSLKQEGIDCKTVTFTDNEGSNIAVDLPELKENKKTKIAKAVKGE